MPNSENLLKKQFCNFGIALDDRIHDQLTGTLILCLNRRKNGLEDFLKFLGDGMNSVVILTEYKFGFILIDDSKLIKKAYSSLFVFLYK